MTDQPALLATRPTSPLSEVATSSLNELFARDPMLLSEQEVDQIVEALRAQRSKWAQEEALGGPVKAGKKANQAITAQLDLKDLDIEI